MYRQLLYNKKCSVMAIHNTLVNETLSFGDWGVLFFYPILSEIQTFTSSTRDSNGRLKILSNSSCNFLEG